MKNNKTSKSCSSDNAMSMQSQDILEPSSKLVHFSADITRLKTSNDGKSVRVIARPTTRAVLLDNNQVTSVSTRNADAFVGALNWNGDCDSEPEDSEDLDDWADWYRQCHDYRGIGWSNVVLNYGNNTKLAKVTGLKAAKHDDHRAIEITLSTEDFAAIGATAADTLKWVSKDLDGQKNVSITYLIQIVNKPPGPPGLPTWYHVVENDNTLTTLETAVDTVGLDKVLDNENGGNHTLFAPTDTAFAKLPGGTVPNLLKPKNKEKLTELLQKHLVVGKFSSEKLKNIAKSHNNYVTTVGGSRLEVNVRGGNVYVCDAKVVVPDVKADNGIVHKISRVLVK
jgi:uncharacterized surface protein with fasciclin (FAS1) repeats